MLPQGITAANTLVTLGLFLGITLSLFLFFKKSSKNKANIFLACLLFIYVLYLIPGYLYGARLLVHFPHVIRLGVLLSYGMGPLILLYVMSCTQKGFKMRKVYWLHFIPIVIDLILNIPFFFDSGAEKYAFFLKVIETGRFDPNPIASLIRIIHAMIYFMLSSRVVLQYRKHLNTTSSFIDRSYHRWLLFFCTAILVPILGIFIVIISGVKYISITSLVFIFVFFIISIYFATLLKPALFHLFPNRMIPKEKEAAEKQKYQNSNLRDPQKERLVERLIQYIETEKPYQEPELTLGELAQRVDIPTHYLSQIINEKINQSFLDFINNYRVEAAKKMLLEEQFSHYTIIAIAYQAGFNSKTAFYTAFKRFTGTSPGKFRKNLNINT